MGKGQRFWDHMFVGEGERAPTSAVTQLGLAEPHPTAERVLRSKIPRGTPAPFCRRLTYGLTAGAILRRVRQAERAE